MAPALGSEALVQCGRREDGGGGSGGSSGALTGTSLRQTRDTAGGHPSLPSLATTRSPGHAGPMEARGDVGPVGGRRGRDTGPVEVRGGARPGGGDTGTREGQGEGSHRDPKGNRRPRPDPSLSSPPRAPRLPSPLGGRGGEEEPRTPRGSGPGSSRGGERRRRRRQREESGRLPPLGPGTRGMLTSPYLPELSNGETDEDRTRSLGRLSLPAPPCLFQAAPGQELPDIRAQKSRASPHVPRYRTARQFVEDVESAQGSGDWSLVREFYARTFDSFQEVNSAFKKELHMGLDGAGVHIALLDAVYDVILCTPAEVQKAALKGIINSLLREWRGPRTKDDLRAYFILLQNPQFGQSSTCVIFAHVLRQVSALLLPEQRTLVQWLHRLHISRFRALLGQLHALVTLRMSQDEGAQLPPPAKSSWWIPAAVRVTALLYAANVLGASPRLPYSEFYNSSLDHVDLTQEYLAWQCNSRAKRFSFCQFPWMLSIHAKKAIIQQDSEQQMVTMARRSVVERVSRRERPDVDSLFLTLRVRRAHLVVDSLSELARKRAELKKKLRVEFVGEVGLDMGGLTKEWFLLLIRQVLRPDYGMFVYHREARCYWFRSFNCDNYSEFSLIGTLMGLAVYNSIPLDLHFPLCCYRKLLSPPLAPSEPGVPVGLCALTLGDLGCVMPELARGLQELLLYEGDVETDMCATFQVSSDEFGSVRSHELCPGGASIPVTNLNRDEFVAMYVDYLLNTSVCQRFAAFYHGFHSVCTSPALAMLRAEEVETLVCGSATLDLRALQSATEYEGYTASDPTVRYFWEVVHEFALDLQKRLLHFATGSDRVPVGGVQELHFKISRIHVPTDWLPVAHTCFNQLCLPPYRSRRSLRTKLCIAISNSEGFGLE
ncbi:unnamed protein product [Lampetra planeri]